jgi:hypothetical protein
MLLPPPFKHLYLGLLGPTTRLIYSGSRAAVQRVGPSLQLRLGEVGLENGPDLYQERFLIARIATSF